jgi:hypothetical protein
LRLHPKIWKYTSPQSKGQRKSWWWRLPGCSHI